MTKILIFFSIVTTQFISNAFIFDKYEHQRNICHELIRDVAINKTKPAKNDLFNKLGLPKKSLAYTHNYHWNDLEVIFVNDEYIDHIGTLPFNPNNVSYNNVRPGYIISFYGDPLKISSEIRQVISWYCNHSPSHIAAILDHKDDITKYYGRYCPQNSAQNCISYSFTVLDFASE